MTLGETKSRPNFGPRQVKTPKGIRPGNVLVHVFGEHKPQSRKVIIVLSDPYLLDEEEPVEGLAFDYTYEEDLLEAVVFVFTNYLCNMGVVPYSDGEWNPTDHLLRTGRHLSDRELKALRARVRR